MQHTNKKRNTHIHFSRRTTPAAGGTSRKARTRDDTINMGGPEMDTSGAVEPPRTALKCVKISRASAAEMSLARSTISGDADQSQRQIKRRTRRKATAEDSGATNGTGWQNTCCLQERGSKQAIKRVKHVGCARRSASEGLGTCITGDHRREPYASADVGGWVWCDRGGSCDDTDRKGARRGDVPQYRDEQLNRLLRHVVTEHLTG
jgi:hypothetical protein